MEQFPKIARARMAAQLAGTHPEAEQLNAFAENALTESERGSVMAHLAVCANCREIVHLAAEARPEGAPVVKPARDGFRWATFQWAAVAASVAVVMVAILVVGPKETRAPQRATPGLQRQAAQPAAAPATSESIAKPDVGTNAKVANQRTGIGVGSGAGVGPVAGGGSGGRIQTDEKVASSDAFAKSAEKKEAPPAGAAAKSAPARDLGYSAPSSQDADTFTSSVRRAPALNQPAQGTVQGVIAQGAPPPAPAVDGERGRMETKSSNEIRKDKQPGTDTVAQSGSESVQVTSREAAPPVASSQKASHHAELAKSVGGVAGGRVFAANLDAASMRVWRLQSATVQSSDDNGKTWLDHTFASGFQATRLVASGQQVWAGGKSGNLYLSRDGGQTWTKISLTGDDIIPLGDVTEIKITNPQLVDVLLNSGDDWQTNDGGKSFRLLPRKP